MSEANSIAGSVGTGWQVESSLSPRLSWAYIRQRWFHYNPHPPPTNLDLHILSVEVKLLRQEVAAVKTVLEEINTPSANETGDLSIDMPSSGSGTSGAQS